MTEFEEKKLEELRKQHEEYLEELKKQHEESLKYLKQSDIESRIRQDEFNEGCHKLAIVMAAISGICLFIGLIYAALCC